MKENNQIKPRDQIFQAKENHIISEEQSFQMQQQKYNTNTNTHEDFINLYKQLATQQQKRLNNYSEFLQQIQNTNNDLSNSISQSLDQIGKMQQERFKPMDLEAFRKSIDTIKNITNETDKNPLYQQENLKQVNIDAYKSNQLQNAQNHQEINNRLNDNFPKKQKENVTQNQSLSMDFFRYILDNKQFQDLEYKYKHQKVSDNDDRLVDGFYFYFYKKKQNLKYEFYLYMTGEADDIEYNPIIIQNKKVLDQTVFENGDFYNILTFSISQIEGFFNSFIEFVTYDFVK